MKAWLAGLSEALHDDSRLSPRLAPLVHPLRSAVLVYKALRRDRAFEHAAAMAYATLAALVPMLLLVFAVFEAVGVLQRDRVGLEQVVFDLLGDLPEIRDVLVPGLLAVNLRTLGVVGIAGLSIISWRLYVMVEAAYCAIFGVAVSRTFRTRVLLFYVAMTVMPVLLAVLLLTLSQMAVGFGGFGRRLALPAVEFLLLLGSLRWFPNTKVRWGAALTGALVSTLLLQGSHALFGLYLSMFSQADPVRVVYGGLAALPIFLFWLWILWLVVLIGVEVAAVVQNYRSMWEAEVEARFGEQHPGDVAMRPGVDAVLHVAVVVARAFQLGEGPLDTQAVADRTGLTMKAAQPVLEALCGRGVLQRSGDAWLLGLPPEQVALTPLSASWRADQAPLREQTETLRRIRADLDGGLPATLAEGMGKWLA